MQTIITIAIIITAELLFIAGVILLFSPELLIRFNEFVLGLSKKKKPTLKKGNKLSIDVFIFTKRFLIGLSLILISTYLIYTAIFSVF